MNKCVLVHSGNRDGYQVALALKQAGMLKYLITDDFFLRKIRPQELNPFVRISYLAFIFSLLNRVVKSGNLNRYKDRELSKTAFQYSDKTVDIDFLVSYSYYSEPLFTLYKKKKILFQLHPHPLSVRNIFENEIKLNPVSKKSLSEEHELLLLPSELNKLIKEPTNADHIIVASTFTKKTLVENGIEPDKIKVVPYGVSQTHFKEKPVYYRKSDNLKILFVGSWNQRKGLSYLASSIKVLQAKGLNIELTLTGRGIIDKNLVEQYDLKNVHYHLNVPLKELILNYHQADVFVFPSLCEGFGLVILEAMSCGVPVITTENTAGSDILTEGVDGFIVPIHNIEILAQRLEYLYYHPEENIKMGKNAAETARQFTWEKFRKGIVTTVDEFEKG